MAELLGAPGAILENIKEKIEAQPSFSLCLEIFLPDIFSLVFIMARPGYWGAREQALLPRKEDERETGAQQFPWKQIRWSENRVQRNPEVGAGLLSKLDLKPEDLWTKYFPQDVSWVGRMATGGGITVAGGCPVIPSPSRQGFRG